MLDTKTLVRKLMWNRVQLAGVYYRTLQTGKKRLSAPPTPSPKWSLFFGLYQSSFTFSCQVEMAVYPRENYIFFGKVASFPCVVPSWNGIFSHWNCCVQGGDMTLECEILLKFTQFLASKCSRAFRNAFSKNVVLGVQWCYQSVWEVDQGLISYGF